MSVHFMKLSVFLSVHKATSRNMGECAIFPGSWLLLLYCQSFPLTIHCSCQSFFSDNMHTAAAWIMWVFIFVFLFTQES